MNDKINFQENNRLDSFSSFCYSYIGLMSGLYIFRKALKILDYLYTLCMLFLAIRALKYSIKKSLSDWTFVVKPYLLIISLLFSYSLVDFGFMLKNLTAITSMLIMGVIFLKKPNKAEISCFVKMLKICLLLNYVFSTIQLIVILVLHINIFYYLGYYLHIYDSLDTKLIENATRITGFIWDPYVLGMFCALGFFLFEKKITKIWILILLYFSFSRAGQLGLFAACLFYYWHDVKRYLKKEYFAMPLIMLLLVFIILLSPKIISLMDLDRGFSRNSAGWRRVEYITKLPEIWQADKNLSYVLFGGAPGYSGARYMLSSVSSMAKEMETTLYWGVETDWFGILIGRGIIGFIFYLLLYLKILLSKKNRINKAIAIAILFGGIGYVYDTAVFACFLVYFAGNYTSSICLKK